MSQYLDRQLFEGLCRQDDAILESIYRQFSRQISDYILKNNGSSDDAKDIMQEGLVIIFTQYCSDHSRFRSFGGLLFNICRYQWLDRLKAISKEEDLRIREEERYTSEDDSDNLLAGIAGMEKDQCWQTTFHQLTDLCQRLLYLKYVEECSGEEMAKELELTNANTVYQRAFDCRERWRTLFAEQCKN
jgi:RNA polymerase sigma factor (sigma-70 family)